MGYHKISILFVRITLISLIYGQKSVTKNHFVMLNVLTGKNKFYEDANW